MRNTLNWLSFLMTAAVASATGASAAETGRVNLTISSPDAASRGQVRELVVGGTGGRYDRLASTSLSLPLALFAEPGEDAGNFKLIESTVFLKADGSGKDARGLAVLPGQAPVTKIDVQQAYAFDVQPQGPVAQNAVAACNGLAASERGAMRKLTMSVAVVWRVTTGRFNFKWTSYDLVAPSEDIQNNRDFYADQETAEAEVSVDTTVVCEPLATVTATTTSAVVKHVAFVPEETKPAQPPAATSPQTSAPVTTASLPDKGKPQCDGGMVRQVGSGDSGYLCLCPGNTKRVETGANTFACERNRR